MRRYHIMFRAGTQGVYRLPKLNQVQVRDFMIANRATQSVAEAWTNGTCIMWTEVVAIRPARWFER